MLSLPRARLAELEAWVSSGYPHETCGVLIGNASGVGFTVARVAQAKNLNTERAADRFELDPDDFFAADQAARADGLEVVGIWHSHPDHPAAPSQTDLDAAWDGYSYVILSVSKRGVEGVTSWRLDPGAGMKSFVEEEINHE